MITFLSLLILCAAWGALICMAAVKHFSGATRALTNRAKPLVPARPSNDPGIRLLGVSSAKSEDKRAPDYRREATPALGRILKERIKNALIEEYRKARWQCVECGGPWDASCLDLYLCDKCFLAGGSLDVAATPETFFQLASGHASPGEHLDTGCAKARQAQRNASHSLSAAHHSLKISTSKAKPGSRELPGTLSRWLAVSPTLRRFA